MKTSLTRIVAYLLLAILISQASALAFNSGDRVQSTADGVNVRSTPSLTGTVIGSENTGYKGTVQSGPYSGSSKTWYYIKWDNLSQSGYTVLDYLLLVPPPAAPTNLQAIGSGNGAVISWTDNSSNEDGFRIERKIGSGGTWAFLANTGVSINAYADTGLTYGTTYYYQVRAYNGAGSSSYTNSACATALATPVQSSPANGATISGNSVTLQWGAVSAAEGYGIDMGTSPGSTTVLNNQSVSTNSYTVTGLTTGTYYWQVRAYNGSLPGLSATSASRSLTISFNPPSAPSVTTLAASSITTTSAQFNASINPNGTSTSAYFDWGLTASYGRSSTPSYFGSGTSSVPVNVTLTGASANTVYHYRIVAVNSQGQITRGGDVNFTTLLLRAELIPYEISELRS